MHHIPINEEQMRLVSSRPSQKLRQSLSAVSKRLHMVLCTAADRNVLQWSFGLQAEFEPHRRSAMNLDHSMKPSAGLVTDACPLKQLASCV